MLLLREGRSDNMQVVRAEEQKATIDYFNDSLEYPSID